ncbi:hypothetical protein CYMTET_36740 [Cymbomonas tetramitiformis]|uniref:Uncharacterized protein n=1 Tax=Cymbomonas tetramitiformis TaxID=36881 RepID=A0AAE0F6P5_9CHLO|nr:hypothetical protein CYMTET_36740 [Cymbomonas tetramitiformis]
MDWFSDTYAELTSILSSGEEEVQLEEIEEPASDNSEGPSTLRLKDDLGTFDKRQSEPSLTSLPNELATNRDGVGSPGEWQRRAREANFATPEKQQSRVAEPLLPSSWGPSITPAPPPWGWTGAGPWMNSVAGGCEWKHIFKREPRWFEPSCTKDDAGSGVATDSSGTGSSTTPVQEPIVEVLRRAFEEKRALLEDQVTRYAQFHDDLRAQLGSHFQSGSWSAQQEVETVQQAMQTCASQLENTKRQLHFPQHAGYRHRWGSDGLYLGLGRVTLVAFPRAVCLDLATPANGSCMKLTFQGSGQEDSGATVILRFLS